ncbi:hypothetical protein AR689_07615 [Arthrobacter sp. EpRS71]|nr:hypothetical protein AR689_07615 [Arthrobacter sp. EpRS71]
MLLQQVITEVTAQTEGAPWWGVPALTGGATLFGALIAYLSARSADTRKAKREKAERIMIDTRTAGLEFLEAVNSISLAFRGQSNPAKALTPNDFLTSVMDGILALQDAWGKFELFAHDDALTTGKTLYDECIVMVLPALDRERESLNLEDFEEKKLAFVNTLRKASGVSPIVVKVMEPEAKKKFEEDKEKVFDHLSEKLERQYSGHKKERQ